MGLGERLARLPPPLTIVFVATGEPIGDAIIQAAFWAILAVLAAAVGRALGMRRRGGPGPGPPQ